MGRPKALLPHPDDRTFVEHAIKTVRPVAERVLLLGSLDGLPDDVRDVPLIPDTIPDAGPMEGLCNLLELAGERWALLVACDMPNVERALLSELITNARDDVDAVAFLQDAEHGFYHACCALYHPRLLPAARRELSDGKRSLQNLLRSARVRSLVAKPSQLRQLANINAPEDFRKPEDLGKPVDLRKPAQSE